MGARAPAKFRLRSGVLKCDICNKKFSSPAVLKTHQQTVHRYKTLKSNKINRKVNKRTVVVKSSATKKVSSVIKKKIVLKTVKKDTMKVQEANKTDSGDPSASNVDDSRKIAFMCPLCPNVYAVYFRAFKHIQNHHCVNEKGEKVDPTSEDIVKPISKIMYNCAKCKKTYISTDKHICNADNSTEKTAKVKKTVRIENKTETLIKPMQYACSGCKEQFPDLKLFDIHVSGVHNKDVESLFFPTANEFTNWKMQMEHQTKTKFSLLTKFNLKQTYRCAFLKDNEDAHITARFCPATLTVQEFPTGTQVTFYKSHYGHKHLNYSLTDKYKKFTITAITENEGYAELANLKFDENDLYLQFKKLMEGIVVESAKLNIDKLRTLIGNALVMTTIITNSETPVENDENVSKVVVPELETDVETKPAKRSKIVNDEEALQVLKDLESEEQKPKIEKIAPAPLSFNFNDCYKDFVDKNCKPEVPPKQTVKPAKVKTKIGQFKSRPVRKRPLAHKGDVDYEVMEQENDCNVLILKI